MKKVFTFFVIILCTIICFIGNPQERKDAPNKNDTSVFICYSQSVTYYHKSATCTSLVKCNILEKVSLDDAVKKYHRVPCKDCIKPVPEHHSPK